MPVPEVDRAPPPGRKQLDSDEAVAGSRSMVRLPKAVPSTVTTTGQQAAV